MKIFSLSPLTLIRLLALTNLASATYSFWDFDDCARPIMFQYAPESCDYVNEISKSSCLCSDTKFWTETAQSVGANCGQTSLEITAGTMVFNCDYFGVPACMTEAQYIAAGEGSQSTPTSGSGGSNIYATPAATASSYYPESSDYGYTGPHSSGGGSSSGSGSGYHSAYPNRRKTPVAAIAGGAVGGAAAIGGVIGGVVTYVKKKKAGQRQIPQQDFTQISEVPKNDQRVV